MHNPINIDHKHSEAIHQEIGERLRAYLRVDPRLPTNLTKQLHNLEGQSPSIVPDVEKRFEGNVREKDRSRFTWPWQRKR